jgi:hypothetical protein
MSEKTNWSMVSKLTLIVLVSWIILAIIFGIYDLNISLMEALIGGILVQITGNYRVMR